MLNTASEMVEVVIGPIMVNDSEMGQERIETPKITAATTFTQEMDEFSAAYQFRSFVIRGIILIFVIRVLFDIIIEVLARLVC